MGLTAACCWSSGKDSCSALYKAKQEGIEIKYLFNFVSYEYSRVSFHGIKDDLVQLQSQALGIPVLQRKTTKDNYEEIFRKTLREIKALGIDYIVRGDIYLQDLQDWVVNVCSKEGIKVISPIWHKPVRELLGGFVDAGFKAVVTSTQASKLGKEWVGRTIDKNFIAELALIKEVDLCGEKGEYHSFVYDGPIFSKKIEITKSEKVLINGYWFLDIQGYKIGEK